MFGDRIAFASERLDVALALTVDIVDDPGLFGLALLGRPRPLANRHG
jgi:hypothetical protein